MFELATISVPWYRTLKHVHRLKRLLRQNKSMRKVDVCGTMNLIIVDEVEFIQAGEEFQRSYPVEDFATLHDNKTMQQQAI